MDTVGAIHESPAKTPDKRRGIIRQYPLQKQSFHPIRHKSAMVGVSLTIALFLVLERKSSLLKCFAVLLLGFFSVTKNGHAEILPVFPGEILPLQGKRLEQNRIMSYEAPPNLSGVTFMVMAVPCPDRADRRDSRRGAFACCAAPHPWNFSNRQRRCGSQIWQRTSRDPL